MSAITRLLFMLFWFNHKVMSDYQSCKLGLGYNGTSALLTGSSKRCVERLPDTYTNWDTAMDACNGLGGTLLHLYSTQDIEQMQSWLISQPIALRTPALQYIYVGLRKLASVGRDYTQIAWTTDSSNTVLTTTESIYDTVVWRSYERSGSYRYAYFLLCLQPALHDCGALDQGFNTNWHTLFGGRTISTSQARGVYCQYEKPSNNVEYRGQRGVRSLAPVLSTQQASSRSHCAMVCSSIRYCQGFNFCGGNSCEILGLLRSINGTASDSLCSHMEATVADF